MTTDILETYRDLVAQIDLERDRPARTDRFEVFRQANFELATTFDRPILAEEVTLVAGTNGKGTVSKTIETCLTHLGLNVGLFTSPHMTEPLERVRSAQQDLTPAEFLETYSLVRSIVQKFELSHFEIYTLMMIEVFFGDRVRPRVDHAVVEVGVGGRLDPTRVLPHAVSVITRIGLDHQELLGHDLAQIATEKFAIVDADNEVVYAPLSREALSALAARVAQTRATYTEATLFPFRIEPAASEAETAPRWFIHTSWGEAVLALLGERAVENTSVALAALEKILFTKMLPIDLLPSILPTLSTVKWPCRMERINLGKTKYIYLSGDHNVQGAESLNEILSHFKYRTLHLIVGLAKNKDVDQILQVFEKIPRVRLSLTLTPFRTGSSELYGEWVAKAKGGFFANPLDAVRAAVAVAEPQDLVVVTGSLYLVGSLRGPLLETNPIT